MSLTEQPDAGDDDLIRAFVTRQDRSAFDRLYRRHSASLLRVALAATAGERAEAEDLLHDTWMIALERLARFEHRSSLRSWLTGILYNRARRLRRAPARGWVELDEDDLAGVEPPPAVERVALEQALASLPPRARLVLQLHDGEGYTHEDIAGLLGIEAGTSKSQLSRARRTLVRLLGSGERSNDDR